MLSGTSQKTDRSLLLEVGLIIALVGLAALFYWGPAAGGELSPRWWHWVVLGTLFFAILALHNWRARRRGQTALRETIREEAAARLDEDPDAMRPADSGTRPPLDDGRSDLREASRDRETLGGTG